MSDVWTQACEAQFLTISQFEVPIGGPLRAARGVAQSAARNQPMVTRRCPLRSRMTTSPDPGRGSGAVPP